MAVEMRKLSVDHLSKGMFVSRLDRPWIETPFPLQGFFIRELSEIDTLRRYCREVYIDVARSAGVAMGDSGSVRPLSAASKPKAGNYPTLVAMPDEVASGAMIFEQFTSTVSQVFDQMKQGHYQALSATQDVASGIVDSVIRNPDAMVWLARMRDKDGYSYAHAIRGSIWAIVFGRYLGLSKATLDGLALAVLLMDVGKTRLPTELLRKPRLTAEEREAMKTHVNYSLEILGQSPWVNPAMLTVVAQHHERFDGSGYPRGLAGNAIAPLAKIAGIVDTYDAMTSPRQHSQALTSVEAVSRLYELRNQTFQARLVDEFIQAIGVYPTGTLVRLSSEQVGIVMEQNQQRRLRPKILLLLDRQKQRLSSPAILDLSSITHDDRGEPLKIAGSLLAGSFDLYPEQWQLNAAAA